MTGIQNPALPPPIPLVPPSLFGTHPSVPDMRNPLLSDMYLGRYGYLNGDYNRGLGGLGLNSLMLGGSANITDKDKLKKFLYRNDLLN